MFPYVCEEQDLCHLFPSIFLCFFPLMQPLSNCGSLKCGGLQTHAEPWCNAPCSAMMPSWEPLKAVSRLSQAHKSLYWTLCAPKCLPVASANFQFDQKLPLATSTSIRVPVGISGLSLVPSMTQKWPPGLPRRHCGATGALQPSTDFELLKSLGTATLIYTSQNLAG